MLSDEVHTMASTSQKKRARDKMEVAVAMALM